MFDIGFSEIVVIAVVALVVIGPERLPKTARTLGHLFGRLQRYVSDVKADISREIELDELRKLQREMQGAARDFEQTVTTTASEVKTGVQNVTRELNEAGATRVSAPARCRRWKRRRPNPRPWSARRRSPASTRSERDERRQQFAGGASQRRPGYRLASTMSETTDTQESFMSHLIELRMRLMRSIIAVVIVLLGCFRSRKTSTRCSRSRCCAYCRPARR